METTTKKPKLSDIDLHEKRQTLMRLSKIHQTELTKHAIYYHIEMKTFVVFFNLCSPFIEMRSSGLTENALVGLLTSQAPTHLTTNPFYIEARVSALLLEPLTDHNRSCAEVKKLERVFNIRQTNEPIFKTGDLVTWKDECMCDIVPPEGVLNNFVMEPMLVAGFIEILEEKPHFVLVNSPKTSQQLGLVRCIVMDPVTSKFVEFSVDIFRLKKWINPDSNSSLTQKYISSPTLFEKNSLDFMLNKN